MILKHISSHYLRDQKYEEKPSATKHINILYLTYTMINDKDLNIVKSH